MITIQINGKTYSVSDRIAQIIRWLLQNERRLSQPNKANITFDCIGKTTVTSKFIAHEKIS